MGTPRGSRSMGEPFSSMAPPAGAEPEPPQDNDPNGASSSRGMEIHPHKFLPLRGTASPVFSRSPSTPRSRQAALANLLAGVPSARENGRLGSRLSSDDSPIRRPTSLSKKVKRKHSFDKKSIRNILALLLCILVFFLFDWWMLSRLRGAPPLADDGLQHLPGLLQGEWSRFPKGDRPPGLMYGRMLGLAAHALAEGELQDEPKELWEEPFADASVWNPCADKSIENFASRGHVNSTGFIMVSANGGLNQQRVAICNAVAVARLLNATLVLPHFLYSSVWKDPSQFGDIYQESFFINYLKDDVTIVKELPRELQSLDLEAIGSFVSDMDLMKEAKPSFYTTYILPILLRNRVVHFYGFGNRLAFDPVPFEIQRLRCKCNFHALKFVQKIQQAGALLIKRMREKSTRWGPGHDQSKILEEENNFGSPPLNSMHMLVAPENFENASDKVKDKDKTLEKRQIKYLGLHLRFEVDMAAYSMCEFGGGESEWRELEAYREIHFPTLMLYKNNGKLLSPAQLREEGKCPLTPEEAVLMLAALGFKRDTRIYLAGAHIFGGQSRMVALTSLYPNLVTKEDLLSHQELQPFRNRSSQLAALDFIGCAAADVFSMTDSGSQLSSLVSGYRMYYGGGLLPTIRPNKRRLASIFSKNTTIEWEEFRDRVKKMVKENKKVQVRRVARSIYRHPRCLECMCMTDTAKN